jgi:hypothetical protein
VPAPVIDDPSPIDVYGRSIVGFGRQRVVGALVDPEKTLPLHGELRGGLRFASPSEVDNRVETPAQNPGLRDDCSQEFLRRGIPDQPVVVSSKQTVTRSQKSDLFGCHLEPRSSVEARSALSYQPVDFFFTSSASKKHIENRG